jgi:hypothetical protein
MDMFILCFKVLQSLYFKRSTVSGLWVSSAVPVCIRKPGTVLVAQGETSLQILTPYRVIYSRKWLIKYISYAGYFVVWGIPTFTRRFWGLLYSRLQTSGCSYRNFFILQLKPGMFLIIQLYVNSWTTSEFREWLLHCFLYCTSIIFNSFPVLYGSK